MATQDSIYLLANVPREHVRDVICANLFDGDDGGGMITVSVKGLLAELVDVLCGPDD